MADSIGKIARRSIEAQARRAASETASSMGIDRTTGRGIALRAKTHPRHDATIARETWARAKTGRANSGVMRLVTSTFATSGEKRHARSEHAKRGLVQSH
jgi:hypothetical protein